MKRFKNLNSDLPDSILSYIFSKLSLKDLVKISTLSKHWFREWRLLKTDLNFDLDNMFDCYTFEELREDVQLFQRVQSQFATRLDRFMLHYQGDVISSVRVKFPLGYEHSDVIDKLISQGIAKGAKRIELLISDSTKDTNIDMDIDKYEFSFTLLSNTDSLMYLHLQRCRIVTPIDFSGLKNLRTLVLHLVDVEQDMLQGLFSNCIHLVDFTLDNCSFLSDLKIISPTLSHLNIVKCEVFDDENIDIIAPNLLSFEYYCYSGCLGHPLNIKAPMLSHFSYRGIEISTFVGFSGLKNVTTIALYKLSECLQTRVLPLLFKECLQLKDVTIKNCVIRSEMTITNPKLRHLKIVDLGGYVNVPPYKITVEAFNLSSFEYSGPKRIFYVTAPSLLKVFWNEAVSEKNRYSLGPIPTLHHIENLAMTTSHSQIKELKMVFGQFQNLRGLELFIDEAHDPIIGYFSILDILMVSQRLQKLSLTVRNSRVVRLKREYAGFFHSDLKYVELNGCVCTINAIEFARQLLRNANSLKKITFGSLDKFYIGAGRWTTGSNSYWFERNFIHERLKDEVKGQCKLVIL
ncbi:putative F-box/FBD/LRR-repeat protein At4g13965 [Trifolium pratense]|uniref:putative F-box/FBD/LRR-repeat protein At4g13965 n=1 Tax=Trifolium pratense TaxID=57577 RepID=UPI001E697B13|nr:putative F-box/FBD/LRR-repeat protein At4g13965 [Trifolium pratense]